MKKQFTWLHTILLLTGMVVTQTLKAQTLIPAPGLYTTVPKGYQALSNVALSDTTTWFRWSQDSTQISISLKMLSASGKYRIKLARLYAAKAGGQIGLINEELLRPTDSSIYFRKLPFPVPCSDRICQAFIILTSRSKNSTTEEKKSFCYQILF